jgi:hypothetical protein
MSATIQQFFQIHNANRVSQRRHEILLLEILSYAITIDNLSIV